MESSENSHGFSIKAEPNGTRIVLECPHQGGVLYSIPAEATWVCESALLPSHALAGFLTELTAMSDDRVNTLLQRWGIYFRPTKQPED